MSGSKLYLKVQGPAVLPHQLCDITYLFNLAELQF